MWLYLHDLEAAQPVGAGWRNLSEVAANARIDLLVASPDKRNGRIGMSDGPDRRLAGLRSRITS